MAIEKELIALRKEKKISQKEMAEVIGVTAETYRSRELGKTDWRGPEMFAISRKFHKTIEDIFLPQSPQKVV
ncbi:helix-turn-helix transcriptional regulator [Lactococcus garvieae]|uniref:DNA-binding transcriptional regulator, XRE-family HTH domain n=1 Tax=Lactococcus garvieae TaxID=1363 RepID=A0A1I4ILZ7_9LACT|nr:helix-turn-helix domain-containing protein [Lactococcus garvieae]SFL54796.1 DNA-binding transcriptional regulator, XRE-family HTH domain [Lactococcus garvieae]